MSAIALARLGEERKSWRKDHPTYFWAKPMKKGDSLDLLTWEAGIPGPVGSDWEGGEYKLIIRFSQEYPSKPPICKFSPIIFHPNVFCCEDDGWSPGITLKQLLMGIHELLIDVNPNSPANIDANRMFLKDKAGYSRKIKEQAKKMAPTS